LKKEVEEKNKKQIHQIGEKGKKNLLVCYDVCEIKQRNKEVTTLSQKMFLISN